MKTIDDLLDKHESVSAISAALVQTPVYGALAFYGKHLQWLNHSNIRPYDWWTGHLSDIFALAALSTVGYTSLLFSGLDKSDRNSALKSSSVSMALYYTLMEIIQSAVGKGDVQDIACYWAGAGIAYFGTKIISKQINNFLKERDIKKIARESAEASK
jgi:hypothetical protein